MVAEDGHRRYKVLEKVGEGAFGTVLRGFDRQTGAEVALKRVRIRDLRAVPVSALRELNALRRLEHPHVVPLLGVHTQGASLVLAMPFLPHSLGSLLAARKARRTSARWLSAWRPARRPRWRASRAKQSRAEQRINQVK